MHITQLRCNDSDLLSALLSVISAFHDQGFCHRLETGMLRISIRVVRVPPASVFLCSQRDWSTLIGGKHCTCYQEKCLLISLSFDCVTFG